MRVAMFLVVGSLALVCAVLVSAAGTIAPLPGPLGGPGISVDVNTMLGAKGPEFTLSDGDGRRHRVQPGATGRPLVLISHMGFF